MKLFARHALICFLFFPLVPLTAKACPANLQSLTDRQVSQLDLCSIYDRYHDGITALKAQGVTHPEKMAGIYGPRFIDFSTWNTQAHQFNYDPTKIYKPAPTTWKFWSAGAEWVRIESEKNQSASEIKPISLNWLTTLHKTALNGLLANVGQLRQTAVIGMTFRRSKAITEQQVKNILNVEYPKVDGGASLITWKPTMCYEEQSTAFRKNNPIETLKVRPEEWPAIGIDQTFIGDDGKKRQCGYISYASLGEFEKQLKLWINYVNDATDRLSKGDSSVDPIAVAAKAQRWFISIHPFTDGNGRISRYVMDYILQSLGLPAPVLQDMDNDMYVSEAEWAREVARGLRYTVSYVEMCAKDITAKGCNVIQ